MNGPGLLESHVGILRTKVGACWPGTRAVFRGCDLHQELRNSDWIALYLFGITGRHFSPAQIRLLHAIWVNTSYPDARIWNNRVAGLAGSTRSTPALGISAALAVSEARLFGGGAGLRAFDFFLRAGRALDSGQELPKFITEELSIRHICGYGRPINSHDERLPWLAGIAAELELDQGKYFRLAYDVEKILLGMGKRNLLMNFAGMAAALCADIGLAAREFHVFRIPTLLAGMSPCWMEAAEKPEGALFPTPCGGIAYEGVAQRHWRGKPLE